MESPVPRNGRNDSPFRGDGNYRQGALGILTLKLNDLKPFRGGLDGEQILPIRPFNS